MKLMTRLLLLVGFMSGFAPVAQAFYNPSSGRWLTRDPLEEEGGVNLYAFADNDSVGSYDMLGMWKLKSESRGQELAEYEAEKGDTIAGLAAIRGLRANQYQKWLTLGTGKMPASENQELCDGTYKVPNTVIAYWAGWGGAFGRFYVGWGARLRALRGEGYKVEEYRYKKNKFKKVKYTKPDGTSGEYWVAEGGTPSLDLQNKLIAAGEAKRLHGLYFWGHGGEDGLSTDDTGSYQLWAVSYQTVSVPYGLGLLWVYACESASAQIYLGSGEPGMSVQGAADGTLIPLPFGGFIDTGK